jgi:AcrR family transcriptional regulator
MAVPADVSEATSGGRSPRRTERRAELLDAAIRVIRREGDTVAMEGIAGEAGISRPILYRHFGDATGLYGAVADDFCQELLYRLRRSARGVPPGRDLLRSQIITYLTFLAEDPEVYRYLNRQVPTDRERSVTHHSGFSRLVADMGGLEAAASRWVEEPTCSADELSDRLTAVLWNGFVYGGMPRRAEGLP